MAAFSRSSSPIRPISLDLRRLLFHRRVDRREDGGDGDRGDPLLPDLRRDPLQLLGIERRDLASVEFVPAVDEVGVAAERVRQIVRPIDEGGERRGSGESQPDRRRRLQPPPLDDGVGEVGGADHHPRDLAGRRAGGLQDVAQRGGDAARDVLRRRRLDLGDDLRAGHQHGVGVRPPDVDPDPQAHVSPYGLSAIGYRLSASGRWLLAVLPTSDFRLPTL
jgi:hypothetical protein